MRKWLFFLIMFVGFSVEAGTRQGFLVLYGLTADDMREFENLNFDTKGWGLGGGYQLDTYYGESDRFDIFIAGQWDDYRQDIEIDGEIESEPLVLDTPGEIVEGAFSLGLQGDIHIIDQLLTIHGGVRGKLYLLERNPVLDPILPTMTSEELGATWFLGLRIGNRRISGYYEIEQEFVSDFLEEFRVQRVGIRIGIGPIHGSPKPKRKKQKEYIYIEETVCCEPVIILDGPPPL